eukprot:360817-Chlamydomonas_euryale.AAC.7
MLAVEFSRPGPRGPKCQCWNQATIYGGRLPKYKAGIGHNIWWAFATIYSGHRPHVNSWRGRVLPGQQHLDDTARLSGRLRAVPCTGADVGRRQMGTPVHQTSGMRASGGAVASPNAPSAVID